MFRLNLYARVRHNAQFLAHETAGAVGTRLSLRPLQERGPTNLEKLGQKHAARSRTHIYPHVVPAKAGTHTPRREWLENRGRRLCFDNCWRWLWVPAFAGTTEKTTFPHYANSSSS